MILIKMYSDPKSVKFVLLLLSTCTIYSLAQTDSTERAGIEPLPILSYDTDTGFGYGLKIFFYNRLNTEESFDIILFNSTEGEQWYKFVFSTPDFESRQGTEFPIALDVTFEYDKWKNYNLYYYNLEVEGTNYADGQVEFTDQCNYELIETKIFLNHAFRKDFTGWFGLKFSSLATYNYRRDTILTSPENVENKYQEAPSVKYLSANLNAKWDTRNSYINPSTGLVLEIELEYAPNILEANSSFFRQAFVVRHFTEIFFKNLILASRAVEQVLIAGSESSQFLAIPVGGSNTLRGVPMDKFRFYSEFLFNNELRFPIWWRFGAIAGLDIGYGSNKDLYPEDTIDWIVNPVVGLRFFMDNFIVRADVGFYKGDIGFYLNFGHIY
ncbi:MAG TPA: BamA/TamA family outer membrane protein [Ignavibacteriaceae bacterium]|nr:BamA/TamA family outer membrane protein [Ignavibacteriaceae bacterium]